MATSIGTTGRRSLKKWTKNWLLSVDGQLGRLHTPTSGEEQHNVEGSEDHHHDEEEEDSESDEEEDEEEDEEGDEENKDQKLGCSSSLRIVDTFEIPILKHFFSGIIALSKPNTKWPTKIGSLVSTILLPVVVGHLL